MKPDPNVDVTFFSYVLKSPGYIRALQATGEPEFVIVIPSYNNEQWCIENIKSCVWQRYSNWTLYYINDASTDRTGTLVEQYIKKNRLEKRCTVIHNKENKGALRNIYETVIKLPPQKIVVLVDGDDFLSTSFALNILAEAYKNGTTWMTYGSYTDYPDYLGGLCEAIPKRVWQDKQLRSYKWVTSHLRTFYAGLFQKIKKADLLTGGRFYPTTWDLAIMFPMLEMASRNHVTFIERALYFYNRANPISDFRTHRQLQLRLEQELRQKTPYQPLRKLF